MSVHRCNTAIFTSIFSFVMASAVSAATLAEKPYAHYDASVVESIVLGNPKGDVPEPYSKAVIKWSDQTGNSFDASAEILAGGGQRDAVYPGPKAHTFASGLVGVDFGDESGNGTALSLLPTGAAQEGLLDFTSNGKNGLTIYLVYHHDSGKGSREPDFNYVLGNDSFPNQGGVGIWVNSTGWIWAQFGSGDHAAFAGWVPSNGDTIISLNYDSKNGKWTLSNSNNSGGESKSGTEETDAADFSSASDFLGLGGSTEWADMRTDGDFGEIVIYDRYIDPESKEHKETLKHLKTKWFSNAKSEEKDIPKSNE
jgi:hypothetical protein